MKLPPGPPGNPVSYFRRLEQLCELFTTRWPDPHPLGEGARPTDCRRQNNSFYGVFLP